MTSARITGIRTYVCDTGHGRSLLFALVDTDVGIVGLGEGSQNDQDAAVVANVEQMAPMYIGGNPLDLVERRAKLMRSERSGRAMIVALSAIEQALWDVAGKLLGAPVYQLLGGSSQSRLRAYATIAAGIEDHSPDGLAAEAKRCVANGYTAVKIVPFRDVRSHSFDTAAGRREHELAVDRVRTVREAVGSEVDILVECGFRFDYKTAVRAAEMLRPLGCFWLEAPLPWDDAGELRCLRETIALRVASGETLHGRRAYRSIIESQAVDVLQPDVKWTGGILEAKKIAAWAETYQMAIAPHNNSGPVATAASAHLCATLPNFLILETPSVRPSWEGDLTRGTFPVENGEIDVDVLRSRPGLGIDFDERVARRAAVAV